MNLPPLSLSSVFAFLVWLPACTLVTGPGDFEIADAQPDSQPDIASQDAGPPDPPADAGCMSDEDCAEVPNGNVTCLAGACVVVECDSGRGDCDEIYENGCEVDTTTNLNHCGRCESTCNVDGATETCAAGECNYVCLDGRGDCNGLAADGCEASLGSPGSCGSCTTPCQPELPLCNDNGDGSYMCVLTCEPLEECAGSCVDTATNVLHCGMCGIECPVLDRATAVCTAPNCGFECESGFGDCNDDVSDGCEEDVTLSILHCGACGVPCAGDGAMWACVANTCEVTGCDAGFLDCN